MCSLEIIALLVISKFTYIAMETGSIPLLDDQEAPLVAIINTRNIRKQILQSLNEPVHQLINATIEELVDDLIRGELAEFENECEQRIHLIEQKISNVLLLLSCLIRASVPEVVDVVIFNTLNLCMQTVHITEIKVVSLIVIRSEEYSIQLYVIKCG